MSLFFVYEIPAPSLDSYNLEPLVPWTHGEMYGKGNKVSESSWWQRHGAVFTSIITLISILTYLHVSLGTIRAEMVNLRAESRNEIGSLRAELRTEIGRLRAEFGAEIGSLRTEMGKFRSEIRGELRDLRASLDRVETKVDEVRGYLGFNPSGSHNELPPKE